MTTETIAIDGVRIRYRTRGTGSPVLLLHGWGGSLDGLDPVAHALASAFRSVSIDLPGHGQSGLPPDPWHVSDYASCVLKFMDVTGLDRPHILAHSFGGRITIKLAAEHPERAGRIVLTGAAGVPPKRTLGQQVRRAGGLLAGRVQALARKTPGAEPLVRRVNQALLPKLASRDYLNAGPLRETLIHIVSEDLTGFLPKIASPVLLIWGDRDGETPLAIGETMSRLIPRNELAVFTGAGHFPFVDQANKFNLLAMRFLREDG